MPLIIPLLASARSGSNNKGVFYQINKEYTCQTDSIPFQNPPLLNFGSYFTLLGQNAKQEFTKPFHLKKKDWANLGKYAAVTLALSFSDEPVQQAALRLRNRNSGLNNLSKDVTNLGGKYEVFVIAGIGAYGLLTRKHKLFNTTLLATQAYLTGGAASFVLKFLSGRTRPSYYQNGVEAEPRFFGPFHKSLNNANGSKENSSFPSGHSTVAFAVATVFATEYKGKPLVQIIAYSAASLISISRITENRHWVTDVVTGAAIGYLSGKLVVNNYHRFQKESSSAKEKNSISFSLNYNYGHIEPGIVYKFR